VAAILSAAMMLEWLAHPETLRGAAAIRDAVKAVLDPAKPENRTRDLGGTLTTGEMGDRIAAALPA
jgi:isocitrate/isopropylmalate dehydrogenase